MRALTILMVTLAINLGRGSVLAPPSDRWLFPLYMFDAHTGWAESREGSSGIFAKGAIGSVLRTTDGGMHWRDVTPPDPPGRQIDPLYVLYPLTSLFAWASAVPVIHHDPPMLFRTTDGGQTWKFATMPGSGIVPSVHFVNSRDGWRVTYDGDIYRSRDGGKTWVKIESAKFFRQTAGITFLNTTTGWIAGHKDPPDSVYYLETHDGGRTWQQRNLPLPHQTSSTRERRLPAGAIQHPLPCPRPNAVSYRIRKSRSKLRQVATDIVWGVGRIGQVSGLLLNYIRHALGIQVKQVQ